MYSEFIKAHFANHPNADTAIRVAELIEHIEHNIDAILAQVGKQKLYRHPRNRLAVHLDASDEAGIEPQLKGVVAQFKQCFEDFWAIEDEQRRKLVINCFLSNIIDSPVGCMEVRLMKAFEFYALYKSKNGDFNLNDLMLSFAQGLANKAEPTIAELIAFFTSFVEFKIPVIYQGKTEPLTWLMLQDYIKAIYEIDDIKEQWIAYGRELRDTAKVIKNGRWYSYKFFIPADDEQNLTPTKAQEYLNYIKSVLSDFYPELSKANVKRDQDGKSYSFVLTKEQHQGLGAYLSQQKQRPVIDRQRPVIDRKTIREYSDRQLPKDDFFFKSLRADELNFSRRFIRGIFSPNEHAVLRPGKKARYTADGRGAFERNEKKPQYTPEQKQGFSQIQSTSLGMPDCFTPVFGFTKVREIAGVIFTRENVLLSNRLYSKDAGTVKRPYDSNCLGNAWEYYARFTNDKILFSAEQYEAFKAEIRRVTLRKKVLRYNEAMVRLRGTTDGSLRVFIGKDSLASRLLAKEYARQIKSYLLDNKLCSESHEVPIVYYIPTNFRLNFKSYTHEEQALDVVEARNRLHNCKNKNDIIKTNETPILFEMTEEEILAEFKKINIARSLVQSLINNKQMHVILTLIEKLGKHAQQQLDSIFPQNSREFLRLLDKLIIGNYTKHWFTYYLLNKAVEQKALSNLVKNQLIIKCAQYGCHHGMVALLDIIKPSLTLEDKEYECALEFAKHYRNNEIADFLIKNKRALKQVIIDVVVDSDIDALRSIVDKLSSEEKYMALMHQKKDGMSALQHAVESKNVEMVRILLNGLSVEQRVELSRDRYQQKFSNMFLDNSSLGRTAIATAIQNNNHDIVVALTEGFSAEQMKRELNEPRHIDANINDKFIPIKTAVMSENVEMVNALMRPLTSSERLVQLYKLRGQHSSSLFDVVKAGKVDMVRALFDGVEANDKANFIKNFLRADSQYTNSKITLLHDAIQNQNIDMVELLLEGVTVTDKGAILAAGTFDNVCYGYKHDINKLAKIIHLLATGLTPAALKALKVSIKCPSDHLLDSLWAYHEGRHTTTYDKDLFDFAVTHKDEAIAIHIMENMGPWLTQDFMLTQGLSKDTINWALQIRATHVRETLLGMLFRDEKLTPKQLKLCIHAKSLIMNELEDKYWDNSETLAKALQPGTQFHEVIFAQRDILSLFFTETSSSQAIRGRIAELSKPSMDISRDCGFEARDGNYGVATNGLPLIAGC